MKFIINVSIIIFFISCNVTQTTEHFTSQQSKWEYKVSEDCISLLTFSTDMTYTEYNCEMDYPSSGEYKLINDTLYLIEFDLESNLPNEKKVANTSISKLIYKKNILEFVSKQLIKDGKVEDIIYPRQTVLYKKS